MNTENHETPRGFSKKPIIIIAAAVIIAGGGAAAAITAVNYANSPAQLITLAQKFLNDADYEKAIIQFDKVLTVDPLNVDAYIGKAEALDALGRSDEAEEVLTEALEMVRDTASPEELEKLQELLDRIKGVVLVQETQEAAAQETAEIEANADPEDAAETSHESANEMQEQAGGSAATYEAADEATATEEIAVPMEQHKVMMDCGFAGGSWVFEADNGEYYFYDIAGNTLTKFEDSWSLGGTVFKTGDLVGCYSNDDGYSRVINTKTNEYVLKEETDGCRVRDVDGKSGRMVVTKIDDSSPDVLLLGVMNNKGEWEYPLTELSSDELSAFTLKDCSYYLMGDHVLIRDSAEGYWYSLKDNKLSKIEDHDFSGCRISNDGEVFTLEDTGLYVFDSTGTVTQITEHVEDIKLLDGGIVTIRKTGAYSWDDYSDMGFDLSGYEYPEIIDVTENTIAFCVFTDGTGYTYIMNKDGSLVTEPAEGAYDSSSASFCGDYFVMGRSVINCKTGEASTLFDDPAGIDSAYIVSGIYSDPGVIVMRSYLTGNFFLVFPDDPETLINPFEVAAQ